MGPRVSVDMRWILQQCLEIELEETAEYLQTIEQSLATKFAELGSSIDARVEGMEEDAKDRFIEAMADDAFQLRDRFPELVRKTAFVFVYGLLEHALLNLCGHVKKYGRITESATDRKDKGIVAAQIYLKKIAKIDFPDQSRQWNDLKQLAVIRNTLSHRNGRLKNDPDKSLQAFISKKGDMIRLAGMNEIRFSREFCFDVIETVRTFFNLVLERTPDALLSWDAEEELEEVVGSIESMKANNPS